MKGKAPAKLGDVLGDLFAKRGYARVRAAADCSQAWAEAAGEPLGAQSRVGAVKRGTLEITLANSALLHEATFRKREILDRLKELLPNERIANLRFRVGALS